VVRGSFRFSAGEREKDVAQKLEVGLTALGLHSTRNLGLLLHPLGLKVPDGALRGLDGVLIGLRTRELLVQLLEARCRLSPVVMVIEDLHWTDSVSEEVLGKIVASESKVRLLLLTTRRPEYVPAWLDRSLVTKLHLEPLPAGDVRHLVQARLGVEVLPEALARQVTEKTEGNPLFAEEIASFLTERGILRAVAGKLEFDSSGVAVAMPASLQSLLTVRVDRRAPKDRVLLQAASVIGRRFDPELLAFAVGETDAIDARLVAMQALDLVHLEGKSSDYLFKHALVRDALYQSLLTEARSALHLKIAEEIERRSGNRLTEVAEVLAHHYRQTDRADKAFAYLAMAGSKSLSVYSLDEAATHLIEALALLDKNADCASDDQVVEFLDSYALLTNLSRQVKVMINTLKRYLPRVDRLGDDPTCIRIRHHYVLALLFNARYQEGAAMQRETSSIADRLGDSRSRAYSLANEIFVSTILAPKPLQEFEILKIEAVKAASDTDDAYIQNLTRFVIGWGEFHRGRMRHARDLARELIQVGRLLNDPRSSGLGLALLTWIALMSDSYAEALDYSEQSLESVVTEWDRKVAVNSRGCALVLLRRTEEGAKLLEDDRRRSVDEGDLYQLVGSDGVVGVCKVLQGNIRGGIRFLEEAILRREEEGYRVAADWYRLFLCEVYLQIIAGNEKLPLVVLLKNLPILLKVMVTAPSRIRALMTRFLEDPQFNPMGYFPGRAQLTPGPAVQGKKEACPRGSAFD
jgi:hypothetical protein